ncbi:MAG: hypothetical protein HON90_00155 [Halobacteriovoraceae bacterium]|nr:hypothetical protein [Halobacteriovoraceae bacterium]
MQDDLEKVVDPEKIISVFNIMITRKARIDLWQSISKKEKHKLEVKMLKMQGDKLYFTTTQKLTKFIESEFIYGYVQGSEMVFKSKILLLSGFKIALTMPEEILYSDLRQSPREDVSHKNIIASFSTERITQESYSSLRKHAKILNFNPNGIALNVLKSELAKFYVGDEITLKYSLGGKCRRTGRIVHVTPTSGDNYTVGIKLFEEKSSIWTGIYKI